MDNHDLSKFDTSLRNALFEQIDAQCDKIRQECVMRFNEKAETRIKALEAEHNSVASNEISEKAAQLNDKFKSLEKQCNASIDERQNVESMSRSARMRYDKLNVRLMNSGLRIHQLLPRVEQMNPEWVHQRAVQSAVKYGDAISELNNVIAMIHGLQEDRDELKAKIELAQAENQELNESLKSAKLKLKNENEIIDKKQKELDKFCQQNAEKAAELQDYTKKLTAADAHNDELKTQITTLKAKLGGDVS